MIRYNQKQLLAAKRKIEEVRKYVEHQDANLSSLQMLYNPHQPETLFLKVETYGIEAGEPFNRIEYFCFDDKGQISNCDLMFDTFNARMTFIGDFKPIEIVGGKVKMKY